MENTSRYEVVRVPREVVDLLGDSSESLLLYTIIKLHHQMSQSFFFPVGEKFNISIEGLLANTPLKISRRDKDKLILALEHLIQVEVFDIDKPPAKLTSHFTINVENSFLHCENSYIQIKVNELMKILQGSLTEAVQELVLYVFFISTVSGRYIHQSLEELGDVLTNKEYNGGDYDNWLIRLKKEEQDEILKVVCWWNLEDITTHKHSKDKSGAQWITRPTLNKVLKRLEDKNVISTIIVKCKGFANKTVLCKTEHKPLIEAYYRRKDSQAQHEYLTEQLNVKPKQDNTGSRVSKSSTGSKRRMNNRDLF